MENNWNQTSILRQETSSKTSSSALALLSKRPIPTADLLVSVLLDMKWWLSLVSFKRIVVSCVRRSKSCIENCSLFQSVNEEGKNNLENLHKRPSVDDRVISCGRRLYRHQDVVDTHQRFDPIEFDRSAFESLLYWCRSLSDQRQNRCRWCCRSLSSHSVVASEDSSCNSWHSSARIKTLFARNASVSKGNLSPYLRRWIWNRNCFLRIEPVRRSGRRLLVWCVDPFCDRHPPFSKCLVERICHRCRWSRRDHRREPREPSPSTCNQRVCPLPGSVWND